jgi:UPF0755 protein
MKTFLYSVVALLAGLAVAGYLVYTLDAPYAAFQKEVFVEVPRGASAVQIAQTLQKAGVIRSEWGFRLARLVHRGRTLQAGEYKFSKPAPVIDVYERITRGDVFYVEFSVPEGKNIFDIATLAEHTGLMKAADFLTAARNPAPIHDLDAQAPSLEGFLFPSTYRLNHHTTAESLCRMMTARFRETLHKLNTKEDVHKLVTLASLVEKEGKLAEDRPKIAQVFEKRLDIGMKLDCDPTTIYAALLDNRYRGVIHKSDLESDNPYNTYRHKGLPPGPIANPGLASLQAVLHPSNTEYLFFVKRPDGSGGHTFSESMAAHAAATVTYRNGEASSKRTK